MLCQPMPRARLTELSVALCYSGGLMRSLPYLPYVQGLPANTVSVIQQANLPGILGGLNSPG